MDKPGECSDNTAITLTPVAHIRSCYTERFGIPRQSGLVPAATSRIVFANSEPNRLSLRGLEGFSHLWVIFVFHRHHYPRSKPLVTPPRLGGKKQMGVFATRSPNRPNPLGMSAVKLDSVSYSDNCISVTVLGGDFLDGTPVLDIKPYVPFADCIDDATSDWASSREAGMPVQWTRAALQTLQDAGDESKTMRLIIEQTLALDPRPGYERQRDGKADQSWGMCIGGFNIRWTVQHGIATIIEATDRNFSSS